MGEPLEGAGTRFSLCYFRTMSLCFWLSMFIFHISWAAWMNPRTWEM